MNPAAADLNPLCCVGAYRTDVHQPSWEALPLAERALRICSESGLMGLIPRVEAILDQLRSSGR